MCSVHIFCAIVWHLQKRWSWPGKTKEFCECFTSCYQKSKVYYTNKNLPLTCGSVTLEWKYDIKSSGCPLISANIFTFGGDFKLLQSLTGNHPQPLATTGLHESSSGCQTFTKQWWSELITFAKIDKDLQIISIKCINTNRFQTFCNCMHMATYLQFLLIYHSWLQYQHKKTQFNCQLIADWLYLITTLLSSWNNNVDLKTETLFEALI